MLKIEYPCRDILPSYKNPTKSIITWAEAKKHLQDVRLRRQNQLAENINECHQLRAIHQQIFNRQFDTDKPPNDDHSKPIKSIKTDCLIPRNDYTSVISRQGIPATEVETLTKLEDYEITQYLSEYSYNPIKNLRSSSPIKQDQSRRLSVSSVASIDKRANKVYEKWPDYSRISQIVGYRIDPPVPKVTTSNSTLSRPSGAIGQRKRNTSTRFPTSSKQIKNAISLNRSSTRREASNTNNSTNTNITPIIIDKPISIIEQIPIKPKLPTCLCPSSMTYSNRIQTRQWLTKNHFSSNAIRTLPLL